MLAARDLHGAFDRPTVVGAGGGDNLIGRRLADGTWIQRASGVYVLASAPRTVRQRLAVALLDAGHPAAVSHRCAAALHRGDGFHLGSHGLEIVTLYGRSARVRNVRVRRTTLLPEHHVTMVDGLRVTTPLRTAADLAVPLGARRVGRLLDDILLRRIASIEAAVSMAGEMSGRPGAAAFRRLVENRCADGYAPPESELEARTLEAVDAAGLPIPVLQASPPWRTKELQRVDLAWEKWKVIIEADGRRWHARMEAFARDRRRTRLAAAHGWLVVPVTWEDLTDFADDLRRDLIAIFRERGVTQVA